MHPSVTPWGPRTNVVYALGERAADTPRVVGLLAVLALVSAASRFLARLAIARRVVRCPATGEPAHLRILLLARRPHYVEHCSRLPGSVTCAAASESDLKGDLRCEGPPALPW